MTEPNATDLASRVDGPSMMRHMEVFARFTKHAGTPEELESLRYCEAELRRHGYATEIMTHPAYISLPELGATVAAQGWQAGAITHSFSRSSPPGGLSAAVVDVGAGSEEAFAASDVAGKIVVMDGIANPVVTQRACRAGAIGQIHISPHEHRHEMCISPVWGSPSDANLANLPTTVVTTITNDDGAALRERMAETPELVVTLHAKVDTRWRQTPILVADLGPADNGDDAPFVFFTGHHDTWYYGVMDNGGANATMLEVARLAATERPHWRRGLRVVIWSGHSQGRYSSSAWYADHHWEEIERRALVHVNVDSTGGMGNTLVADTTACAELRGLAAEAIDAHSGQIFTNKRMGRAGDQSFWGIGVPAMFANMSEQPKDPGEATQGMFRAGKRGGFGTGWWWHTPDDLLDKIDEEILVRDTQIYMHAIWRLLTDAVLPLDYAEHGRYLLGELDSLGAALGERFELDLMRHRAERFVEFSHSLAQAAKAPLTAQQCAGVNETLRLVARIIVPADYTLGDRFEHDPATPQGPYPCLQPLRRLATLEDDSDEARFLATRMARSRNRVAMALQQANQTLERGLAAIGQGGTS